MCQTDARFWECNSEQNRQNSALVGLRVPKERREGGSRASGRELPTSWPPEALQFPDLKKKKKKLKNRENKVPRRSRC